MTKDPYSTIEQLLEELHAFIEEHSNELPTLKKQLQVPIDQAYFSVACIRGQLPHVKDPQSGYVVLPQKLAAIRDTLNQALPSITDAQIKQSLTETAEKIPTLLVRLPQPINEALNQLDRFLTATAGLNELKAKVHASLASATTILQNESFEESDSYSELTEQLEEICKVIHSETPKTISKATANTLSCLAKIVVQLQSELQPVESAAYVM